MIFHCYLIQYSLMVAAGIVISKANTPNQLNGIDVEQKFFTNVLSVTVDSNRSSTSTYSSQVSESAFSSPQIESSSPLLAVQFEDFPAYHEEPLNVARAGVLDAFLLAEAAISALRRNTLSSSFYRYFQESDRDRVLAAFDTIIRRHPVNRNEGEDISIDTVDETRRNSIRIWWDDPQNGPTHCHDHDHDQKDTKISAYFFLDNNNTTPQPNAGSTWNIVICPALLQVTTKTLQDILCSSLKAHMTQPETETAGRIILHEMFHAPPVAAAAGVAPSRTQIQDYQVFIGHSNDQADEADESRSSHGNPGCNFEDLNDGDFVTAYGPFWCMFVNKNHGFGTWNADNYAWFAVEEFFRQKCGIDDFADPVREVGDEIKVHGFVVG